MRMGKLLCRHARESGHPVFAAARDRIEKARSTGSSAFADDDGSIMEKSRDRSWSVVIPGCAFLGAGPESILRLVVMDSALALRAPRNDDRKKAGIAPGLRFFRRVRL